MFLEEKMLILGTSVPFTMFFCRHSFADISCTKLVYTSLRSQKFRDYSGGACRVKSWGLGEVENCIPLPWEYLGVCLLQITANN